MKVEIPDWYCHDIEDTGCKFMQMYSSHITGSADRYIYAKKIVEAYSGEDLIQYIAEILLAYDALKYKDCPIL